MVLPQPPGAAAGNARGPSGGARLRRSVRSNLARAGAAARGCIAAGARWTSREWAFTTVLGLGALLRLIAMLGFPPILWFNDGFEYLGVALRFHPYLIRPDGYSAFLRLLLPFHSLALVSALQHLMGLAVAVMTYLLLRRWQVPRWLGVLATGPQLLDIHQIELEQLLLSDTLALFLLVGGMSLLLRGSKPTPVHAGAAALLLAAAALTRTVALPLVVVALLYLVLRRTGWRTVLTYVVLVAAPIVGYAGWYDSSHGSFALNNANGIFLYARVMAFADCTRFTPAADVAILCDPRDPTARPRSQDYIWHASPLDQLPGPGSPDGHPAPAEAQFTTLRDSKAQKFAIEAILGQPSDYLQVATRDFLRTFGWRRTAFPNDAVLHQYTFTRSPQQPSTSRIVVAGETEKQDANAYDHSAGVTHVNNPFATMIIAYQHVGQFPGALLGIMLIIGFGGIAIRRRSDIRRWPAAMLWTVAMALLLVPPFTAEFDYRYVLPSLPFAGGAFALGVAMLRTPNAAATDQDHNAADGVAVETGQPETPPT